MTQELFASIDPRLLHPSLQGVRADELMSNLPEQLTRLQDYRGDLDWEAIILSEKWWMRMARRVISLSRSGPTIGGLICWWDAKPRSISSHARGVAVVVNQFAEGGIDVLHTRYASGASEYWDSASLHHHAEHRPRLALGQELTEALVKAMYVPVNLNSSDVSIRGEPRREHNGLLRSGSGNALVRRIKPI